MQALLALPIALCGENDNHIFLGSGKGRATARRGVLRGILD